jgi:chemotaxis protein MotA
MNLSTIIGLVGAIVIVVLTMIMDGGSPTELFHHPQAIMLTAGGALMASAIGSQFEFVKVLPKAIMMAFQQPKVDRIEAIDSLVKMADKARRDGLLALEEEVKNLDDKFLKKGIMLVVDGTDPGQVEDILAMTIENMESRHRGVYSIFIAAGGYAPTFGVIGTVMGLINVLKDMSDPDKLAASIAGAFSATLWGLLSANLVYIPFGTKLKVKSEEEAAYRYLLMEGVLGLQAGDPPRVLRDKLSTYLPPKMVKEEDAEA